MHFVLAANWFLDPIVNAIAGIINLINTPIHNLGWSLVIFALLFKVLFWGLNTKQFKAMINMQKIGPKLKVLQTKYAKSDPQRFQAETAALYKESGTNPMAGCWPMLVQYPIIISVYYAVLQHKDLYAHQGWLWIGSHAAATGPKLLGVPILASSLGTADLVLLALYMASMYVYSRYGTMPATDPQQAQTQKLMAIFSPVMLGYFGFRFQWPSAMVLYWFSYNVFTMGQQFYLLKKYHQPLSALDSEHAVTDAPVALPAKSAVSTNGVPRTASKKKKGAKK